MANTSENDAHGAETAAADGGHGAESLGHANLEHAEVGMPQLDPTIFPNLIFWLIVSIVLLYLILTRVALPRLTSVLAERSDAISNEIEQAQLLNRRSEEAEVAYNAALAAARDDAHKIAGEAKAVVNREVEVAKAKADAEIAARGAESEGRIGEIRDSAAESVRDVAGETAREIIKSLMPGGSVDEQTVASAVAGRLKG